MFDDQSPGWTGGQQRETLKASDDFLMKLHLKGRIRDDQVEPPSFLMQSRDDMEYIAPDDSSSFCKSAECQIFFQ
jgi:hypothetical protein